jgi:hypothetical protein
LKIFDFIGGSWGCFHRSSEYEEILSVCSVFVSLILYRDTVSYFIKQPFVIFKFPSGFIISKLLLKKNFLRKAIWTNVWTEISETFSYGMIHHYICILHPTQQMPYRNMKKSMFAWIQRRFKLTTVQQQNSFIYLCSNWKDTKQNPKKNKKSSLNFLKKTHFCIKICCFRNFQIKWSRS